MPLALAARPQAKRKRTLWTSAKGRDGGRGIAAPSFRGSARAGVKGRRANRGNERARREVDRERYLCRRGDRRAPPPEAQQIVVSSESKEGERTDEGELPRGP